MNNFFRLFTAITILLVSQASCAESQIQKVLLETSKGNYAEGIALGMVLLFLAFLLNGLLHHFQGKGSIHP